jgi:hypothetical protein
MIPRPVRNNNPGDLEAGAAWQGLMPAERMTPLQQRERFAVFETPEWGFRALCVLLRNYQQLHGAGTVAEIIGRFAPPNENNTAAYIAEVAGAMNVTPLQALDLSDPARLFALAKAITRQETGSWEPYWQDAQLQSGIVLAGGQQEVA